MNKLPIVGVMGSGTKEHPDLSVPLGMWVATLDVHLLTGGGQGVMNAVSRAFFETPNRKGSVIGIIPSKSTNAPHRTKDNYPNVWVEIAIKTHLPKSGEEGKDLLSRNHINVLTADVIIVLPGSSGTFSEAALALEYNKKVIGFLNNHNEASALPKTLTTTTSFDVVKNFIQKNIGYKS